MRIFSNIAISNVPKNAVNETLRPNGEELNGWVTPAAAPVVVTVTFTVVGVEPFNATELDEMEHVD